MNFKYFSTSTFLCIFCALSQSRSEITTIEYATKIEEIILNDNKVRTWNSTNYPEPYPPENKELVVKVEEPYFILIEVKELDLDGLSGDFLVIQPGSAPHPNDNKDGKLFTFFLKSPRKYMFHYRNVYMGLHVLGKNHRNNTGFSITYQRVSNGAITTTVAPTTSVTWPTAGVNDAIYFTAHVYGKNKNDFKSKGVLNNLTTSIANMAINYCSINNVTLLQKITSNNVLIQHLNQCPYNWPNSNKCVTIRFALPIWQEEKLGWNDYQMKSNHLEAMWLKYARESLAEYDMSIYAEPNDRVSFIKWIVISGSIIFILLFTPFIVNGVSKKFKSRHKKTGDTADILPNETGNSKLRSSKNPYQTTPQIFENMAYEEWDFDIPLPKKTKKEYYEDNSDDEIVLSHFQHSRNDTEKSFKKTT